MCILKCVLLNMFLFSLPILNKEQLNILRVKRKRREKLRANFDKKIVFTVKVLVSNMQNEFNNYYFTWWEAGYLESSLNLFPEQDSSRVED